MRRTYVKSITILICVVLALTSKAFAFDIMAGGSINSKYVEVKDKEFGNESIAKLTSGFKLWPSLGLRTGYSYFTKNTNWMYFYELDWAIFNMESQEVTDEVVDLDTSIIGYSLFAVPTAAYNFSKGSSNKWGYKVGVGLGISYIRMVGNFRVTNDKHPEFGQKRNFDIDSIGSAFGIFFEASKNRHSIVLQNFGPSTDNGEYQFEQMNFYLMYRYRFSINYGS